MRPLVHIGYHKTGSTWLQTTLFGCDATGLCSPLSRRVLIDELVLPHALVFRRERARQIVGPALDDAIGRGLVPVLSHERLSGNPHSGGFDSSELAHRLAAVVPEARILISIREQRSMILSTYKQYVRIGGAMSIERYLDPPQKGRARAPAFDAEHFAYHRLIGLYRSLFGRERVLVLPYERLRSSPRAYAEDIVRFAGGSVEGLPSLDARQNSALSGLATLARRWSNRLVGHDRVHPGPLGTAALDRAVLRGIQAIDARLPSGWSRRTDERVAKAIESAVGDCYRESNRATASATALDLEAFGYSCG